MVCITPGEMRDGGASPETGSPPETGETGSSQDATGETGASSDASTDNDASQSPDGSCALTSAPKPGPFCGSTQCPTGIWCCYSAAGGGPQCSNICPAPAPKFVCDGPRSCPNGGLCCITLQATASPASACTKKTGAVGSDCVTSSACPNSQVRSCVVGSDCGANGVCVPTEIELPNGQGVAVWGVCAPNDGGS